MILTHEYRILPSDDQAALMTEWLELLRRQWNDALGQRLDWLTATRCPIDRCSLVSCPLPVSEAPLEPNYYRQAGSLKQIKQLFPAYQGVYADVLQQNLMRLDKAWKAWREPDSTGKRRGRPRFKKAGELRSFTFPRINCPKAGAHLVGETLQLSKIGSMPVVLHRPLPEGFVPKTCTVVRKADGWYVCITLEDKSVPSPEPVPIKRAVGIDVGLDRFLTTSDGEVVPIPRHYRRAQKHLARQQRQLSRKVKGSANWKKQATKVACLQLHVARQRKAFHYQVAHWLVGQYDLLVVEDLNVRGLARTRLAKSILDAAWGRFLDILTAVAVKRGKQVLRVDPRGTSQNCCVCEERVPKALSERVHDCPRCGSWDRDLNSAIEILKRGLRAVGLPLSGCGGSWVTSPLKQQLREVILGSSRLQPVRA